MDQPQDLPLLQNECLSRRVIFIFLVNDFGSVVFASSLVLNLLDLHNPLSYLRKAAFADSLEHIIILLKVELDGTLGQFHLHFLPEQVVLKKKHTRLQPIAQVEQEPTSFEEMPLHVDVLHYAVPLRLLVGLALTHHLFTS